MSHVIPVDPNPYAVAAHPDGRTVFVSHLNSATVAAIDTATKTLAALVPIGRPGARGIAVRPDGAEVYVTTTGDDNLWIIETATMEMTADSPIAAGSKPRGVVFHPDGTRAYIANIGGDTVTVIDTATRTAVATIPVGDNPRGIAVHPSGQYVYTANGLSDDVSAVDTELEVEVARIPVGDGPVSSGAFVSPLSTFGVGGWSVSADGSHLMCRNVNTGDEATPGPTERWDCEQAGMPAQPGDFVAQILRGTSLSTDLSGAVIGIEITSVLCRNLTTGASATLAGLGERLWRCSGPDWSVEPDDRISVQISGFVADPSQPQPPTVPVPQGEDGFICSNG